MKLQKTIKIGAGILLAIGLLVSSAIFMYFPISYYFQGIPKSHLESNYCQYLTDDWPTRVPYTCSNLHMCTNEAVLGKNQSNRLEDLRKKLDDCPSF